MLLNLPEPLLRQVALHCSAEEICNLVSSHRSLNESLARSANFWLQLLRRDCDDEGPTSDSGGVDHEAARRRFVLHSHVSSIARVEWIPISDYFDHDYHEPISDREGHLCCVLDGPGGTGKRVCIHGGFTDDDVVYLLTAGDGGGGWTWDAAPAGDVTNVYGATLTALPSRGGGGGGCRVAHDVRCMLPDDIAIREISASRAVRFGGFRGGGYSAPCDEVWVLTIYDISSDNYSRHFTVPFWDKIEPSTTSGYSRHHNARAYHTATLVCDRYLVIIGGMGHEGSTDTVAVLDTQTWTWIGSDIKRSNDDGSCRPSPSGRHGHSVVDDSRRNRLVLFGGGSGTDLLRSGVDNSEVWELKMGGDEAGLRADGSLQPCWLWTQLHGTIVRGGVGNFGDDSEDMEDNESSYVSGERLSPLEALNLGRCHNGLKVSPDSALLLFGSGRPNTNAVLGYNLKTDEFIRPNVSGPLPVARFTGVAAVLGEGYIFCHGGFNSDTGGSLGDMHLLDLAPQVGRVFDSLPLDDNPLSHPATSDEDLESVSRRTMGGDIMRRILLQMMAGNALDAEEMESMIARIS